MHIIKYSKLKSLITRKLIPFQEVIMQLYRSLMKAFDKNQSVFQDFSDYSDFRSRFVTLQPTSIIAASSNKNETFEQKNLRLNRPLSPHLTIYQPQLTTILSIFHRITGVAVTGYFTFVAASKCFVLHFLLTKEI